MRNLSALLLFLFLSKVVFSQLQIDWQNCFVGPDTDNVNDVLELEDGYFILGSYGIKVSNPLILRQSDVWLIKTDLDGNFLWDKKFGGSEDDFGKKILKTIDNNVIIVAQSSSSDFDLSNSPYPNSTNYWIYKINLSGDIIWSKIVGGNGPDWPHNATLTNDDGVIVVGRSQSSDGDVSINYGYWDIWAIKLDSEGNKVWEYTIGTEGVEWADEVIESTEGNLLIGGTTAGYGNGNISCDPYNEWGESLLTKFNSNFEIEWQQCYGGSLHEVINTINILNDGFLVANSTNSGDGDLSGTGYHGEVDVWITRLDTMGNIIWSKCFGGSQSESGFRIFTDSIRNLTFFGSTNSLDGDIQGLHAYDLDIWVFKIDSLGNLKWQQCIGGTGSETVILGVTKVSNDSYIIAAKTFASFSTGDFDCYTDANTSKDIWFLKVTDTTVVSRNESKLTGIKVFPNPTNDYVIVQNDKLIKGHFYLSNLLGEKITDEIPLQKESHVYLSNVMPGIYIYTVKDQDGNFNAGKLIIN